MLPCLEINTVTLKNLWPIDKSSKEQTSLALTIHSLVTNCKNYFQHEDSVYTPSSTNKCKIQGVTATLTNWVFILAKSPDIIWEVSQNFSSKILDWCWADYALECLQGHFKIPVGCTLDQRLQRLPLQVLKYLSLWGECQKQLIANKLFILERIVSHQAIDTNKF